MVHSIVHGIANCGLEVRVNMGGELGRKHMTRDIFVLHIRSLIGEFGLTNPKVKKSWSQ